MADSRFLVMGVEEVQIPDEMSIAAVLQASRRRKFLVLGDVHMSIEVDGVETGKVPKGVVVLVVAGMAGESGCVDPVIEMFVDRGAKNLHRDNETSIRMERIFKMAYLVVGYCNIVDDRLVRPGELEDNLVVQLLSDKHKPAVVVYHIEAGKDATLKLPKEPRNPFGL